MATRRKYPDLPPFSPDADKSPSKSLRQHMSEIKSYRMHLPHHGEPSFSDTLETKVKRLLEVILVGLYPLDQEAPPIFEPQPGAADDHIPRTDEPYLRGLWLNLNNCQQHDLASCLSHYEAWKQYSQGRPRARNIRSRRQLWKLKSRAERLIERSGRYRRLVIVHTFHTAPHSLKSRFEKILLNYPWDEVMATFAKHGIRCSRELSSVATYDETEIGGPFYRLGTYTGRLEMMARDGNTIYDRVESNAGGEETMRVVCQVEYDVAPVSQTELEQIEAWWRARNIDEPMVANWCIKSD